MRFASVFGVIALAFVACTSSFLGGASLIVAGRGRAGRERRDRRCARSRRGRACGRRGAWALCRDAGWVEYVHGASLTVGKIALAQGLERLSSVRYADDWSFIVAREGADLVILLVDEEGVVVDDVTMPGLGGYIATPDCEGGDQNYLGVAVSSSCSTRGEARIITDNGPRSLRPRPASRVP